MTTPNQRTAIYDHITYHQPLIDSDHRNSLWYGGDVLSIKYKNHIITLSANGDVIAEYQSAADDKSKTSISINDKSNSGAFYKKLHTVIKNDAELLRLAQTGQSQKRTQLDIQNNNWWEAFVTQDSVQTNYTILNSENYDEALNELLEKLDQLVS